MADQIFVSQADIVSSTNTPSAFLSRAFNTITESIFETNSISALVTNQFVSSNGIVTLTSSPNFRVIGTSNIPVAPKKLQYIIDDLISDSVESKYPKFKELIRSFLKFQDLTSIKSTLNILNNNNINYVYDEFVDSYLNNLFNEVIDLDVYGLTNQNKKRFLQLSRLLNNLKGNKKIFDFLFRTFTDIRVAQGDLALEIDKIIVEFIENEDWWLPTIANYYDGSIFYDGSETYYTDFQRPFTYQFLIDQSRETMLPLIRSVHPAGFDYEFLLQAIFEDTAQFEDTIEMSTRYFHFYSYGEVGFTNYTYNGAITYSEYHDVPLTF